jgi:hypothetical protein
VTIAALPPLGRHLLALGFVGPGALLVSHFFDQVLLC